MAEGNQLRLSNESVDRLREILGDDAVDRLLNVSASRRETLAAPGAAPRDAGKFVRQLASLYCLPSQEGENARACVAVIIRHALELVNLISEANPEPKP